MKKVSVLLFFFALLFASPSFAYADTPLPAWKDAYHALIEEAKASWSVDQTDDQRAAYEMFGIKGDNWLHSYTLYDIDKDGIPELVLHFGTSTAGSHGRLYCFADGETILIKEFGYGGNYFAAYPDDNGVLIGHARDFAQSVKLWTLVGSEIVASDVLFSETLEVGKFPAYTEISDIVPGAVRLTEFPADTILPLLTYESWADALNVTNIGSEREVSTAFFPENDEDFFQDVIDGKRLVMPSLISMEYDEYWEDFEPYEILFSDMELSLAKRSSNYSLTGNIPIDFSKRLVTYVDLNNDGQLEAVCSFNLWIDSYEDLQLFIILSEQGGSVYAYGLFDISITGVDTTGTLYCYYMDKEKTAWIEEYAFRLVFDKDSCFMLYVPLENYNGERTEWADAYREALASRGRPARGNTSIEVAERFDMLEAYRSLWNYAMGNADWSYNPRYPELTGDFGNSLSTYEGLFYSYHGPISSTIIAVLKEGQLLPIAVYDYFEERMVCNYILNPSELEAGKAIEALLNSEIYYIQFA